MTKEIQVSNNSIQVVAFHLLVVVLLVASCAGFHECLVSHPSKTILWILSFAYFELHSDSPHLPLKLRAFYIGLISLFIYMEISNPPVNALLEVLSTDEYRPFLQDVMSKHNINVPLTAVRNDIKDNVTLVEANDWLMTKGSTHRVSVPSYEDIFCVPKIKDRQQNKLYGRVLLKCLFKKQHGNMLWNQRTIRNWLKDAKLGDEAKDLRHNEEMQNKIKKLISQRKKELVELEFPGRNYIWKEEDIYQWIKLSIQSKRKHTKRKNHLLNIEEKDASDPITSEDHIQYDGTDHLETNISSTKNQEVHFNEADDHLNDHHISYQEMIENETLSDSDIFANNLTHLEDEIDDIGLASQPSCLGVRSIRARKMSLKKLESLQNQSLKNIRRENKRTKSSFDFGSSLTTKSMFQNQSMVDAVENLATTDLETILMKFFNMDLVDELYSNLKCSYKIVLAMSKKDFRRRIHVNELDGDTMKEEMVKILLEEEHIALRPTLNGHIELDDVIRLK